MNEKSKFDLHGVPTLLGETPSGELRTFKASEDGAALVEAREYIWNVDTLAWEKATGSSASGIAATIDNFPADYPDSGANSKLTNIYNVLNNQLNITLSGLLSGILGIDSKTLSTLQVVLGQIYTQLNLTLSGLLSGISGVDVKTLSDLNTDLSNIIPILNNIKSKTDNLDSSLSGLIWGLDSALISIRDTAGIKRINDIVSISGIINGLISVSNMIPAIETGLAKDTTLSNIYAQLNITQSALRDAITGVSPNNKSLSDIYSKLDSQLNISLSGLRDAITGTGSNNTLSALYTKLDAQLNLTLSTLRDAITGGGSNNTLSDLYVKLNSQLNITLSGLLSGISGTSNKTLTNLETDLSSIYSQLNITLSGLLNGIAGSPNKTLSDVVVQISALEGVGANIKTLYDLYTNITSVITQLQGLILIGGGVLLVDSIPTGDNIIGQVKLTNGSNSAIIETDSGIIAGGQKTLLIINLNYVWDAGLSAWAPMLQPAIV